MTRPTAERRSREDAWEHAHAVCRWSLWFVAIIVAGTFVGWIVELIGSGTVGGEEAEEGSYWPFLVSVQEDDGRACSGSLINSEWVLSAAHCYQNTGPEGVRVVLGKRNLAGPKGVSRAVAEIVLHPRYDPKTYANDTALLRLASPVPFTDEIRPVCLAATGSVFSNSTPSWVHGWDKITEGGPMVYKYGSDWVQIGVVSWGCGCAPPCLPGVYARVDPCEMWIESVVKTDLCFIRFEDTESSSTRSGLPAAVGSVPEDPAVLLCGGVNGGRQDQESQA